MAFFIGEDCIQCDACIDECPNNAIYEPDDEFNYAQGTALDGDIKLPSNGETVDAGEDFEALSDEIYFIVTDKCTECQGFHEEPQCASVCPTDSCNPDPKFEEDEAKLLEKKAWLHGE